MNQTLLALVVGVLAGAGGAFVVHTLQGDASGGASSLDWAPIQERLDGIEERLEARANPPGTLATREGGRSDGEAVGSALLAGESNAALDSLLAKIDDRVGKTVEQKLAEARAEEGEEAFSRRGGRRRGRKRVSLADAARELELTAQQEDELRRIFEDNQRRFFKLMAGPAGDPEEVKREVMDAVKTGSVQKLMPKYVPKVMSNIGELMAIQADRETAVQKTLGPEKARRFNNDYSVEEDDILGMRGGGMRFGAEVRSGN